MPDAIPSRTGQTSVSLSEASALVEAAAARLWSREGADALAYLTGPRRLTPETIKAARLGWTAGVRVPTRDGGRSFQAVGLVVPWFDDSGRLAKVNIVQPDGIRPKYVEAFRDPARIVCYPGLGTIIPGCPLVVVEGEFDALLLGQTLGVTAAVVSLESASARPGPAAYEWMVTAPMWYLAMDGDKAAAAWPASSRRVRPPEPYKDWTEAAAAGVDLARWWRDRLSGIERPPLFTWDELST